VLEEIIQLIPNLSLRLELTLQVSKVLLDAVLDQDECGLEQERGESGDDVNLLLDLLGEEIESEELARRQSLPLSRPKRLLVT
jgi:hypothetical protein